MTTETTPAGLLTGVWSIDAGHSDVSFSVRHMMMARIRGGFSAFTGAITVAEDPAASSVVAEIDTTTLDTRNPARDEHLRGSGFFDVVNFPAIRFASTGVRLTGPSSAVVAGELTVRDRTRPVELTVEHTGLGIDPWGAQRIGFVADVTLDRRDFGLDFNVPLGSGGVLVGTDVAVHLEIEAVRATEEPPGS
ncbi:YceI family protein [Saccharothrix australiensis]|uniref:Polyisoprenoid-binding protein YceI n=1 Tax=Saccharothrix australiensis TaxID=2072 RepID=A0A495W4S2_9PSEU|nr:YceI family protein [Saccharothrix australiensis]RKT55653.1 polyisoprenoid-binding protein YceI [Saccharothrix australiensis]